MRRLTIFAAGSSGDRFARVFAPGLTESLGQLAIVANVTGAGGVAAAKRMVRSAAD